MGSIVEHELEIAETQLADIPKDSTRGRVVRGLLAKAEFDLTQPIETWPKGEGITLYRQSYTEAEDEVAALKREVADLRKALKEK